MPENRTTETRQGIAPNAVSAVILVLALKVVVSFERKIRVNAFYYALEVVRGRITSSPQLKLSIISIEDMSIKGKQIRVGGRESAAPMLFVVGSGLLVRRRDCIANDEL